MYEKLIILNKEIHSGCFNLFLFLDFIVLTCPFSEKMAVEITCDITLKLPKSFDSISKHTIEIKSEDETKNITITGNSGVYKTKLSSTGFIRISAKESYFKTSSTEYVISTPSN